MLTTEYIKIWSALTRINGDGKSLIMKLDRGFVVCSIHLFTFLTLICLFKSSF